ncbi:hypothetical protein KMZ32_20125 [Phycicoccus sp. MAQZ13P-2]|uniref:hypothetical protein n=1 Tax=Phycicoccus mangrovi TaxID=2840470 RepID=UPI001BFFE3E8|nr:hypothetical protein [Phycicoccus mangrovi]MBT9257922.1 hypothetical protein [Phycicoccus mangrovi]MBT9276386.1 hypothetical protein [Phycicoccus mangrovi]
MPAAFVYYAAVDDLAALDLVDLRVAVGGTGPGHPGGDGPPARRFPRPVFTDRVDPVLRCSRLEELLTARTHAEVAADHRSARALGPPDRPGPLVVTVTRGLQHALATATAADLRDAVAASADTDRAAWRDRPDVHRLARLAREALAADLLLYCRVRA